MSVAIGPFAISSAQLVFIIAISIMFVVGWLFARRRQLRIDNPLFNALLLGMVSARVVFVIQYWSIYQSTPWHMLDIRDGGFNLAAGLLAALLLLVFYGWRQAEQRLPLLAAAGSFLLVAGSGQLLLNQQQASWPGLPELSLNDIHGQPQSLQDFHGKPVVINLWATWCAPCRREMPVLQQAQQHYPGLHILLVNQGDSPDTIQAFIDDVGLELEHLLLDPGWQLSQFWQVRGMPTTLFFDAEGNYRHHHFGEVSAATLHQQLQKLR